MPSNHHRLSVLNRSRRYRFLLLSILIVWSLIALIIFTIDPENIKDILLPDSFLLIGALVYLGLFLLLSLIFLSSSRAIIWSIGLTVFLFLRLHGLGNNLTLLFLLGFLTCLDIYRWQRSRPS